MLSTKFLCNFDGWKFFFHQIKILDCKWLDGDSRIFWRSYEKQLPQIFELNRNVFLQNTLFEKKID